MAHYAHVLDKEGNFEIIDGRYLHLYPNLKEEDLHLIAKEQLKEYYLKPHCKARYLNGQLTYEEPHVDLDAQFKYIQTDLLNRTKYKLDQLEKQYLSEYSQTERESFERQIKEARGELPPLLLTEILASYPESMTLEKLKLKVLEKSDLHAIIRGALIAKKQSLERAIESATTHERLRDLAEEIQQWSFSQTGELM